MPQLVLCLIWRHCKSKLKNEKRISKKKPKKKMKFFKSWKSKSKRF